MNKTLRLPITTIKDAKDYLESKCQQKNEFSDKQKEKIKLALKVIANSWAKVPESEE